jgi:hypothetical protein
MTHFPAGIIGNGNAVILIPEENTIPDLSAVSVFLSLHPEKRLKATKAMIKFFHTMIITTFGLIGLFCEKTDQRNSGFIYLHIGTMDFNAIKVRKFRVDVVQNKAEF